MSEDKKIYRKKRASVDVMIRRYELKLSKIKKHLKLKKLRAELLELTEKNKEDL